jgi:hypothetical protein
MEMLLYLADFEELRIIQTIKEFDVCDKEAFARSLWVNHGNEPKVIYGFRVKNHILITKLRNSRRCS